MAFLLSEAQIEECQAIKSLKENIAELEKRYARSNQASVAEEINMTKRIMKLHIEIWHDEEGKCKIFRKFASP